MNNRIQLIAQAANKIKAENNSQKLKLSDLFRQAAMLSDLEYTSKKDVDSRTELVF